MKKTSCSVLIIIACLFFPGMLNAQTDSLELKLKDYKNLFEQGLISRSEYEAAKAKALNIDNPEKEDDEPRAKVKFTLLADVGIGMHMGKRTTKVNYPPGYSASGNIIKNAAWKAPMATLTFAPGIAIGNTVIATAINLNYQFTEDKSVNNPYFESAYLLMLRQRFGKKDTRILADVAAGYGLLKYQSSYNYFGEDYFKRQGLVAEAGLGVSLDKTSAITVKLCYRFEYLMHNKSSTYTDNVGNVIGNAKQWDYLHYLALRLGFQLN